MKTHQPVLTQYALNLFRNWLIWIGCRWPIFTNFIIFVHSGSIMSYASDISFMLPSHTQSAHNTLGWHFNCEYSSPPLLSIRASPQAHYWDSCACEYILAMSEKTNQPTAVMNHSGQISSWLNAMSLRSQSYSYSASLRHASIQLMFMIGLLSVPTLSCTSLKQNRHIYIKQLVLVHSGTPYTVTYALHVHHDLTAYKV